METSSATWNTSREIALAADALDPLATLRNAFYLPSRNGREQIYFCGNSLGLQPKQAADYYQQVLQTWRDLAIDGFFEGPHPWLYFQENLRPGLSRLVGCREEEVTVMNTLTVNLHLLLLSFYKPTTDRYTIIMEAGAFPSDQYALETIVRHFGLDPDQAIVEVAPREGEKTLRENDILETIERHAATLALVLFGGIHYYTGQLLPMAAITTAAHKAGAIAGFDLAHAAGNVPLHLHDWDVDFAVWCNYKYLNGGPGAVGASYIHERFARDTHTPRLGGWWGNDESTRFEMKKGFIPKATASGWNISTNQVMNMVGLQASLDIFNRTDMQQLRGKSLKLTGYLLYLLEQLPSLGAEIITPTDPEQRGAQLSLFFPQQGKAIHEKMLESGIVADYREPGVIRVAPAPLYNSFEDVYRFYEILSACL